MLSAVTDKERAPRPPTPLGPAGEALRENLKRIRSEERRYTFAELSKRLKDIGRPIPVLGLRRIEMGQRRVDVDDLMALALALDVPPVLLLLPLGHELHSEVAPGRREETWDAVRWVTGRDRDQMTDWRHSGVATQLWEAHDAALVEWVKAIQFAVDAQKMGVPASMALERMEANQKDAEKSLALIRANMRTQGLTPPFLPNELSHLEPPQAEPEESEGTEQPSGEGER